MIDLSNATGRQSGVIKVNHNTYNVSVGRDGKVDVSFKGGWFNFLRKDSLERMRHAMQTQYDQFMSDYNALIDIILEVNPDCALLFITNNDSYKRIRKNKYQVNPTGTVVEEAFLELGQEHNAAVWDLFDIMGGLKSMETWQHHDLAKKDKIHFTTAGYTLLGDLLFNALMDNYMEHLNRKGR